MNEKIQYLSVEEALLIYNEVMIETKSRPMFREIASLEFALEKVKGLFMKEGSPLLFKAAFLLKEIITKHPFLDGNKRGASAIADGFLRLNGKKLKLEREDVRFLEEIDSKSLKLQAVKEWLEKRAR